MILLFLPTTPQSLLGLWCSISKSKKKEKFTLPMPLISGHFVPVMFSLHYPLVQMPSDQCITLPIRQDDEFSNDVLGLK